MFEYEPSQYRKDAHDRAGIILIGLIKSYRLR
jgi:hypothetical protein